MADTGKTIALIKALGGSADPAVIEQATQDWLDDHPEATTTVQDGSITKAKLDSSLQGTVDDVGELKSAITQLDGAVEELEAGSLSAVTATEGQVPMAKGDGTWEWAGVKGMITIQDPTALQRLAASGQAGEAGKVGAVSPPRRDPGACPCPPAPHAAS